MERRELNPVYSLTVRRTLPNSPNRWGHAPARRKRVERFNRPCPAHSLFFNLAVESAVPVILGKVRRLVRDSDPRNG